METKKLGNGKFYKGKFTDPGEYSGWFCGSFLKRNHPGRTAQLEIKYARHKKGDIEKPHYHRRMIEVLIFLEGKARYRVNKDEVILQEGDFLFVDVNNVISGEFLRPSKLLAIHTPSIPDDEVVV